MCLVFGYFFSGHLLGFPARQWQRRRDDSCLAAKFSLIRMASNAADRTKKRKERKNQNTA